MTDLEYLKKYGNEEYEENVKRLKNGEPVQYIVGNVNFYGYTFKVNKNVLIPRFETEELVFRTIKYLKETGINKGRIVDLGTGSGCIAITLKLELENFLVDAVDISNDALLVAQDNANSLNANINFYLGNMLEPLNNKYDCIISNPPYISYDEKIDNIVKNNEPHLALYAPNNGTYFYEEILKNARNYLKEHFVIAFEIGYMQGEYLKKLSETYFPECKVILECDLENKDRYIFIIK